MTTTRADAAQIRACGRTDTGRKRRNNEDALLILDVFGRTAADGDALVEMDSARAALFAVCDGMGGESAGEIASALVVETLRTALPELILEYAPHAALERAIDEANVRVRAAACSPDRDRMGATLTAVLVRPPVALIAQIGDSRAYVLRHGLLHQLTRDQNYVQYLLDSGVDAERAARIAPQNVILQAVGRRKELTIVTSRLELRADDVLLLCSDGLTGEVPDGTIAEILAAPEPLITRRDRLIAAANEHGGRDNVTVVLVEVRGESFPEPASEESVRATFQSAYPTRRTVRPPEEGE